MPWNEIVLVEPDLESRRHTFGNSLDQRLLLARVRKQYGLRTLPWRPRRCSVPDDTRNASRRTGEITKMVGCTSGDNAAAGPRGACLACLQKREDPLTGVSPAKGRRHPTADNESRCQHVRIPAATRGTISPDELWGEGTSIWQSQSSVASGREELRQLDDDRGVPLDVGVVVDEAAQ